MGMSAAEEPQLLQLISKLIWNTDKMCIGLLYIRRQTAQQDRIR